MLIRAESRSASAHSLLGRFSPTAVALKLRFLGIGELKRCDSKRLAARTLDCCERQNAKLQSD
ncbi:MAG: hypothetical protein ACKERG_00235 [Candidatus Hodgkinia cicadicola]